MSSEFLTGVEYPHPFDELVVALCESASRQLCVLSPTLDHAEFEQAALISAVGALVRRSRQTEVRILISDSRAIVTRGHGLLQLARRLPSTVLVR